MRKVMLLFTILSFALTMGMETVLIYAEDMEQITEELRYWGLIQSDSFCLDDGVLRCEAIIPILKVFGTTQEIAEQTANNIWFYTPPFYDLKTENNLPLNAPDESKYYPYLICGMEAKIIYGYQKSFYPYEKITADEAAAFMIRGIEHIDILELETIHERAKKIGLFLETDRFYNNGMITVTKKEFLQLLNRMVYQPAFWYLDSSYKDSHEEQRCDLERSKRYADILNKDFPDNSINWVEYHYEKYGSL